MKLKKVTSTDPIERTTLSLHQSTHKSLSTYQEYYKSVYGEPIQLSHLIEEIVKDFINKDKDFTKFTEDAAGESGTAMDKSDPK